MFTRTFAALLGIGLVGPVLAATPISEQPLDPGKPILKAQPNTSLSPGNGTERSGYLQLIAEWGSAQYWDVAVQGNYAYCAAQRAGLEVVDISDPTTPEVVANVNTEFDAKGIVVVGSFAYIATARSNVGSEFAVFDVSDPLNPTQVGELAPTGSGAYTGPLDVSGNNVFVAYSSYSAGGFDVIDISDPSNPSLVTGFRGVTNVYDIHIDSGRAYLAAYTNGLWIVDVSDPSSPAALGMYDPGDFANSAWASGAYAYITYNNWGMRIVDVSVPSAPTLAGIYSEDSWDVWVEGSLAYLSCDNGLQIVDVSAPTTPTYVGGFSDGIGRFRQHVVGNTICLGDREYGTFQTIDVSSPTFPLRLGSLQRPERTLDIDVDGDMALVGTRYGLVTLDVSDPSDPQVVSIYPDQADKPEISAVDGESPYAYAASQYPLGIRVLDVSDPTTPSTLGVYSVPARTHDLFYLDDYLYVGQATYGSPINDGLLVLDVSNPTFPWLAGSYGSEDDGSSITVRGDYAYLNMDGPMILDVSAPWAITLVSEFGNYGNVTLDGDLAHHCRRWPNGSEAYEIFNVSDPTTPTLVGSLPFPCSAGSAIAVDGGFAYVTAPYMSSYYSALYVLDVRDPSMPVPVDTLPIAR